MNNRQHESTGWTHLLIHWVVLYLQKGIHRYKKGQIVHKQWPNWFTFNEDITCWITELTECYSAALTFGLEDIFQSPSQTFSPIAQSPVSDVLHGIRKEIFDPKKTALEQKQQCLDFQWVKFKSVRVIAKMIRRLTTRKIFLQNSHSDVI